MAVTLHINNLPFSGVDAADIYEAFTAYGVTDVQMSLEAGGRGRGFAFVNVADADAAQLAIASLDGCTWGGRTIGVALAHEQLRAKAQPSGPTQTVFLGNLPYDATEADVRELLAEFDISRMRMPQGKGYAFVRFRDLREATVVLSTMGGRIYQGRKLYVNPAREMRAA